MCGKKSKKIRKEEGGEKEKGKGERRNEDGEGEYGGGWGGTAGSNQQKR